MGFEIPTKWNFCGPGSQDLTVDRSISVVTRNHRVTPELLPLTSQNRLYPKATKMNGQRTKRRTIQSIALTLGAGICLVGATGCQVSLNGQTLPSPYYLQDDVQYFPSGPEFKLPREAAALRAARAEEKLSRNR